MPPTVRPPTRVARSARAAVAAGTSWLSLLAATSLGVPSAETTTTEIRTEGAKLSRGPMRLVVQTYAEDAKGRHARPSSSTQRPVTADELRRGVHVDLIDLSGGAPSAGRVVAWVEPGTANLEYDGGRARPSEKSMVGTARKSEGRVLITLRKNA